MLPILIGIIAGFGLPVQTSVNSKLKQRLGSPFYASLVSFIVAILLLFALLLFLENNISIDIKLILQKPIWIWFGGIFGVAFLTGNILLFPRLGCTQTVIMPVLGQIITGVLIDNFGLFEANKIPLNLIRIIGAILVILGVYTIVSSKNTTHSDCKSKGIKLILWSLFGIFIGSLSAMQIAINGTLSELLLSPIKASVISFTTGIVFLLLTCLMIKIKSPNKTSEAQIKHSNKHLNKPWWMWIGGTFGAIYIYANIYISPIIGAGMTVILLLIGAMAGGVVVDKYGLFESAKKPFTLRKFTGLALMIIGAVFIKLL